MLFAKKMENFLSIIAFTSYIFKYVYYLHIEWIKYQGISSIEHAYLEIKNRKKTMVKIKYSYC